MKNILNPLGMPWDKYLAMHLREIVAGFLLLVLLLVILAFVDSPGGTAVSGTITAQGRPVVFGTVTAITADGRTFTVPIESDGTYVLRDLPPGPVRIAVSSPNPRPVTERQAVEPTTVGAGPSATGDRRPPPPGNRPAAGRPRGGAAATTSPEGVSIAAPNAGLPDPPLSAAVRAAPAHGHPGRPAGWFRIPGRYANPSTSGLGAEVRQGKNTVNIKLD